MKLLIICAVVCTISTTSFADSSTNVKIDDCPPTTWIFSGKPILKEARKKNDKDECETFKVILDLNVLLDKAEVKISPENLAKLFPKNEGKKPVGFADYCISTALACTGYDCNTSVCYKNICDEKGCRSVKVEPPQE